MFVVLLGYFLWQDQNLRNDPSTPGITPVEVGVIAIGYQSTLGATQVETLSLIIAGFIDLASYQDKPPSSSKRLLLVV